MAYHFHWSLDEILDLEHADRQRFAAEMKARAAAWREQAPLQPTLDRPPLTAPARPFVRGLAGSQAPDPILESIGRTANLRPMSGRPSPCRCALRWGAGPALPRPVSAAAGCNGPGELDGFLDLVDGRAAPTEWPSSPADVPTVAPAPGGLPAQMAPRSVPVVAAVVAAAPPPAPLASGSSKLARTRCDGCHGGPGAASLARLSPLQRRALEVALPMPGVLSLDPVRPQSGPLGRQPSSGRRARRWWRSHRRHCSDLVPSLAKHEASGLGAPLGAGAAQRGDPIRSGDR